MALVASAMNPAGYAINNAEDRETGSGFEFTRRKRWPNLLLQELVGSALFCLKPVSTNQGSSHSSISGYGWKMVYVSPAVGEMLGQKPAELEGKDFFDLVFAPDQPQLQNLFTSLVLPTPPLPHQSSSNVTTSTSSTSLTPPSQTQHTSSQSYTTHVRMMADSPVVWELRAHTTGPESASTSAVGVGGATVGFGYGGNGALVPQQQGDSGDGMKGKALWVMGRRAVENMGEEAKAQSLDAFLELKLENERLREELKKLQQDLDDEDISLPRPVDPTPAWPNPTSPGPSSPSPSDDSSTTSSPALKAKPVKKRQKKASVSGPAGTTGAGGSKGAGGAGEGEGLHVCVTCGRTDSPEWRKGPLGPKTLCNACGLRWAKRNSTAPTRKEKKAMAEGKAA